MSQVPHFKYRFPAEWEPHRATWLAWPHEESDFPGKLSAVHWVFCEIIRALVPHEEVHLLCQNEEILATARDYLTRQSTPLDKIHFHIWPYDRSWLRDSAPTGVINTSGKLEWIRWDFNAWAKYDNYKVDCNVPKLVSDISGGNLVEAYRPDNQKRLILEGGAIESDGQGTLLVTEECLLSEIQCRNPNLTKSSYEEAFAKYLGINKTIWLAAGCVGDDTHGHIDDIARFVAPGKIVLAYEEDRNDDNFEPLDENYQRLLGEKDASGRTLEIIKLPMPHARYCDQARLPCSYANFYIANKVVLVPTFNDINDADVLMKLRSLFPGRSVIGINCTDMILGYGTIHCASQQEPAII